MTYGIIVSGEWVLTPEGKKKKEALLPILLEQGGRIQEGCKYDTWLVFDEDKEPNYIDALFAAIGGDCYYFHGKVFGKYQTIFMLLPYFE